MNKWQNIIIYLLLRIFKLLIDRKLYCYARVGSFKSRRHFGPHICAITALESRNLQYLLFYRRRFSVRLRLSGFLDTLATNPYGDGVTYYAPMFYSPCGLFYNAGLFKEKGWEVPTTWEEMWALGDTAISKTSVKGSSAFSFVNVSVRAASRPVARCTTSG